MNKITANETAQIFSDTSSVDRRWYKMTVCKCKCVNMSHVSVCVYVSVSFHLVLDSGTVLQR